MVDLPPHLRHRTAVLLRLAAGRAEQMGEAALRDQGISGREYGILELLAHGSPRTQIELARDLHIDRTTCAALLARLEQRNLIVRAADPTNRRANHVTLTGDGETRRARASQVLHGCDDQFQANLSAQEQATLQRLLHILVEDDSSEAHHRYWPP